MIMGVGPDDPQRSLPASTIQYFLKYSYQRICISDLCFFFQSLLMYAVFKAIASM